MAASVGICKHSVGKWRRRFAEHRVEGLRDEARPSAPCTVETVRVEAPITATLESVLPDAIHGRSRGMARTSGLSVSTVQRIWRASGLQPHRIETFKLSTDPDFIAIAPRRSDCEADGGGATGGVRDVVGVYLDPPDHALVLCMDETSQIQALDRRRPMLPMRQPFPDPSPPAAGEFAPRRPIFAGKGGDRHKTSMFRSPWLTAHALALVFASISRSSESA